MLAFLPRCIKNVSRYVAKAESRWGGTAKVRVIGSPDQPHRVQATNGKMMIQITGYDENLNYPGVAGCDWDGEALIDPKIWGQAFRMADEANSRTTQEVLVAIGVDSNGRQCFAANEASFYHLDTEQTGRFPNFEQIWPTTAPIMTIQIDAKLMTDVLSLFADLDAADRSFELLIWGPEKPVGLRKVKPDLNAEAMLMPLIVPNAKQG